MLNENIGWRMWMLGIIIIFSLWFIAGVAGRLESKTRRRWNTAILAILINSREYTSNRNSLFQRNKHHSSCQARAIDLNSRAAKRLPYSPYSMVVAFLRKQNLMRQPQQSDYIPSILRIRRSYIENWFGCSSRIPNSANTRNGIHGTSSAKCLYQLNFLFISKSSSDAPSSFLCFLFRRVFFLLLFCRNVNKIIRFIFISTTSWRHYKGRKAVAEIYVSRFAFCHHQGRRYLLCYNVWNWKKKLWFPKVLAAIVNALCLALICRR